MDFDFDTSVHDFRLDNLWTILSLDEMGLLSDEDRTLFVEFSRAAKKSSKQDEVLRSFRQSLSNARVNERALEEPLEKEIKKMEDLEKELSDCVGIGWGKLKKRRALRRAIVLQKELLDPMRRQFAASVNENWLRESTGSEQELADAEHHYASLKKERDTIYDEIRSRINEAKRKSKGFVEQQKVDRAAEVEAARQNARREEETCTFAHEIKLREIRAEANVDLRVKMAELDLEFCREEAALELQYRQLQTELASLDLKTADSRSSRNASILDVLTNED